jgi:hypothetical protein
MFFMVGFVWCGGCSPTSPTATDVSGNWSGTVVSAPFGNGTFLLTLSESGSTPSAGTWTLGYTNGSTPNKAGTSTWSLSGSAATITLTPILPVSSSCVYNVTGTVSSIAVSAKPTMTGTYQTANCTVSDNGTFTIAHQ